LAVRHLPSSESLLLSAVIQPRTQPFREKPMTKETIKALAEAIWKFLLELLFPDRKDDDEDDCEVSD